MSDYTELKRLATRIVEVQTSQDVPISKLFDDFDAATSPEVILALISRIEQDEMHLRAFSSVAETAIAERNQFKAENETLIAAAQALRDEWRKDQADAKRHRFARDCAYGALTLMEGKRVFVELDYPSGEFSGCDQAYDAAIDAAMGKGEQS